MKPVVMKALLLALLVAALVATTGWVSSLRAQDARVGPGGSRPTAERAAVDLKQGMTPEQVQQLLGKPWRTALSANGGSTTNAPWQGTLRWTYTWNPSASERSLNVDFNAKTAEQWSVSGWSWSGY